MLVAMAISAFLCVFLVVILNGSTVCFPTKRWAIIPMTELCVITQPGNSSVFCPDLHLTQSWGKYPKEMPSVNLDVDWVYRKLGKFLDFVRFGAFFWNGLNDLAHALLVAGMTDKVCVFAKGELK